MKVINTRFHGFLDYLTGALLVAAPWLFDFADGGYAQQVAVAAGITTFVYSLLTKYEWGVLKTISINVHLVLDFLSGLFLLVSPWAFEFTPRVTLFFIIVGLTEIFVSSVTDLIPYAERNRRLHAKPHI